jgi:hypothetical protein
MAITFGCPSCSKQLRASDDKAGRKTRCPKCGTIVGIPDAGQAIQEMPIKRAEPPVVRPIPPASSKGKEPAYDPATGTWEALVIAENQPEHEEVERESAGMTGDESANSSISSQKSDAGGRRAPLLIGLGAGAAVLMLLSVAITLWAIGFFAQPRTQTQDAPRVVNVDGKGVEQRPEPALPPAVVKDASSPAAQGIGAQVGHLVEATIRAPLLSEKQKAAASDAIKAIGKIEAGAQVGVNFQQYGQLVIDAKAVVNEAMQILPSGELLTNLEEAMDAYKDARTVWNHKIQFSSLGLKKEYGQGELIERYALPLNEQKVADPELAMQVMWAVGAERLTIARALLEGKIPPRPRFPARSANANPRAQREADNAAPAPQREANANGVAGQAKEREKKSPRTEPPNAPAVAVPNQTTAKGGQQRQEQKADARLASIESFGRRGTFISHHNYFGILEQANREGRRDNATFEIVPGLSDPTGVSFRSVNVRNYYLSHADFRIVLGGYQDSNDYRQNSTFKQVKAADGSGAVAFEAVNWPGRYIHARGGNLFLDKAANTAQYRKEAAFLIVEPLSKAPAK